MNDFQDYLFYGLFIPEKERKKRRVYSSNINNNKNNV